MKTRMGNLGNLGLCWDLDSHLHAQRSRVNIESSGHLPFINKMSSLDNPVMNRYTTERGHDVDLESSQYLDLIKIYGAAFFRIDLDLSLQVQITTLLAANRTGGQVRTDFSTFPTPQFARMLQEKTGDSVKIGQVQIPVPAGKGDVIPVNIQPHQLRHIHGKLIM